MLPTYQCIPVQPTISNSFLKNKPRVPYKEVQLTNDDNIFKISDPSDWALNKFTLDYKAIHGFTQNVHSIDFSKSKHVYSVYGMMK